MPTAHQPVTCVPPVTDACIPPKGARGLRGTEAFS